MVVLAGTTPTAFAAGNTKPGWGFGDKNHKHIGPPGQSVSVKPGHHHGFDIQLSNIFQIFSNTGNNSGNGSIITTGISNVVINLKNLFGQS